MGSRDRALFSVVTACAIVALSLLLIWAGSARLGWVQSDSSLELTVAARIQEGTVGYPGQPDLPVNVVWTHDRAPATVSEEAEWLERAEMVGIRSGTRVRLTGEMTPDGRQPIEVLTGPHRGFTGWVWHNVIKLDAEPGSAPEEHAARS